MSLVSRAAMHFKLAVGQKGFITLCPVAATTGKARPDPRGFSLNTILAIRHDGVAEEEARMRRVETVAWCDRGRFEPCKSTTKSNHTETLRKENVGHVVCVCLSLLRKAKPSVHPCGFSINTILAGGVGD